MTLSPTNKKIAVVYDWIDSWGGAERILLELHRRIPQIVFYAPFIDIKLAPWSNKINLRYLRNGWALSFFGKRRKLFSTLLPFIVEDIDLRRYDLVLSITSAFVKGLITQPKTVHICYLLTPPRYLWGMTEQYLSSIFEKLITSPALNYLRQWDYIAAQRPDKIIAVSEHIRRRCFKYYRRESDVLYPPFDTSYWLKIEKNKRPPLLNRFKDFFLLVSRLEPYKKVISVVEVFNRRKENLIIVGRGSEESKLKRYLTANIQWLPFVSDEELAYLYSSATALIMPQEEDFGYVALEAQFFGCPVIAYGEGGVLETVISEKTGIFYSPQTPMSLQLALARFHTISYNLKKTTLKIGRSWTEKFNSERFFDQLVKYLVL